MQALRYGTTSPTTKRAICGVWVVYFMSLSQESLLSKQPIWTSFLKESHGAHSKQLAHNTLKIWATWSRVCFSKTQLIDLHASNSLRCLKLKETRHRLWEESLLKKQKQTLYWKQLGCLWEVEILARLKDSCQKLTTWRDSRVCRSLVCLIYKSKAIYWDLVDQTQNISKISKRRRKKRNMEILSSSMDPETNQETIAI